ncbi:MAG: hypothetical protein HDR04_13460 [Lachnospiraceae bacterium]|nr:hypothetical protein [Lachnospiraceae bacterium]
MKITILSINTQMNDEIELVFDEKIITSGQVLFSDNFCSANKDHKLIIQSNAVKDIFEFIEWDVGKRSDIRVEQGGVLLGKRFYDSTKDIHFAIVSKAIVSENADGSSAFLEITPECWRTIHDKIDDYKLESGDEVVIVGWFHTHPNMLPVFMSGTDRSTQKLFFDGDNTYSVVINPQRHLMKAFRAAECYPTQAFFLIPEESDVEE